MMKEILADIITIGDEILYGQTIDTNSAFMGVSLQEMGVKVRQITSISDNREAILNTLKTSSEKADIVLITGGLGPTLDDITKHTLCEYFDDHLDLNEEAWTHVQAFYHARNREISEVNRLQAHLPTTCTCLPNKMGTASGMWFEKDNVIIVSMPGVPREMKGLMENEVLSRLAHRFDFVEINHTFVNTVGIPESNLAEKISLWERQLPPYIKLAYLPSLGCVKLRLTMVGDHGNELTEQVNQLIPLIDDYVYSTGNISLEDAIAQLLINGKHTISTAESCTGGNVARALTSVSGSSAYFMGGMVSYDNKVKIENLGVSSEILKEKGAVSEEVVTQMVKGAQQVFHTDIAVATTGVAGPNGGTAEKPVGTVWIAFANKDEVITKKLQLGDFGRTQNIDMTTIAVLNLIRKFI